MKINPYQNPLATKKDLLDTVQAIRTTLQNQLSHKGLPGVKVIPQIHFNLIVKNLDDLDTAKEILQTDKEKRFDTSRQVFAYKQKDASKQGKKKLLPTLYFPYSVTTEGRNPFKIPNYFAFLPEPAIIPQEEEPVQTSEAPSLDTTLL